MDMLLGKVVPLRMGFVGVINRSQEDIISKLVRWPVPLKGVAELYSGFTCFWSDLEWFFNGFE